MHTTASFLLDQIEAQNPPAENATRNGKVARLPRSVRDLINRMLDDGLPYRVIIDELGETAAGLNPQNLSNWKQGGYQDYCRHEETITRVKAQTEFALDLLQELGQTDPTLLQRACHLVATAQLLTALKNYGDDALRHTFTANPASFLTAINTLCSLSNATLAQEQQRRDSQSLPPVPSPSVQAPSDPSIAQSRAHHPSEPTVYQAKSR